jgi:hypothetical protein
MVWLSQVAFCTKTGSSDQDLEQFLPFLRRTLFTGVSARDEKFQWTIVEARHEIKLSLKKGAHTVG